jgi:hypothetical protein
MYREGEPGYKFFGSVCSEKQTPPFLSQSARALYVDINNIEDSIRRFDYYQCRPPYFLHYNILKEKRNMDS